MYGISGMESPPCLCGDVQDGITISATDPVERTLWTYRRCASCGLERLSPRPPITDMGRYYADDYAPYSDPAPRAESRADRLKRLLYETYYATPGERSAGVRRYRRLLQVLLFPLRQHAVLSFHPPDLPRRVFEFGAGTGADLVEFRKAGWEVSGCEPSATAVAAAAANGITLQPCNAEDAVVPSGVSCVYMNNVFEHLHDPPGVLAKIQDSLLPGGVLVLIVPNHGSWAARLFGSTWPGYDPPRHLWGYTPGSIGGVLRRAGFRNLSIAQKYPLSTYCWSAGLEGWRMSDGDARPVGKFAVRVLGRGLVIAGMVAAMAGAGDYMRVIAEKP
jgi:SAM-dependent methyltransferase